MIFIQCHIINSDVPDDHLLKKWAKAALDHEKSPAEFTIQIVNSDEIADLNARYRHKNKPTNILSFPFEAPTEYQDQLFLGDLVICAEVVNNEALEQNISKRAHWAHMVVHGALHLLKYDHENEHDAKIMENKETHILTSLGFPNPYSSMESQ